MRPYPPMPRPDGPVDETIEPVPIDDIDRPGWFTLMAPQWMPPSEQVTQALGICFTEEGRVVLVTWADDRWTFPGGTVEPGETVEQTLIREVAEEACARVLSCRYLAAQHVSDPLNPDGRFSYYQTRWWARVELDPWEPRFEMTERRLVPPESVLETLFWTEKEIAARLLAQAVECERVW